MKYVTMMDAVWRISDKKFKRLTRELQETGAVADMDKYGTMITDHLFTIDEIKNLSQEEIDL